MTDEPLTTPLVPPTGVHVLFATSRKNELSSDGPIVKTRPSGRCALPAQKMLPGALIVVGKVCDVASQTAVGCGCCQPSKMSRLPFFSRMLCTATIGQFISADHWPEGDE